MSLENKYLGNGDYFVIRASSSHLLLLTEYAANKLADRSTVEVNIENKRSTVVCSRCYLNLKFGNITLSFGWLCQRIVLKCVPHVQHEYFSSFNQSDRICGFPTSRAYVHKNLKIKNENYPEDISFSLYFHTMNDQKLPRILHVEEISESRIQVNRPYRSVWVES